MTTYHHESDRALRAEALLRLEQLAHEAAAVSVTPEVHAAGRQCLINAAERGAPLGRAVTPRRGMEQVVRTRTWVAVGVFAAAASIAVVVNPWSQVPPLTYEVVGGTSRDSGYVSASPQSAAELRFSDGTLIEAQPSARLRVDDTRPSGAHVLIERGTARVQVRHRTESQWVFMAGPFEAQVTGTRFSLSWDPTAERVELILEEGGVDISGPFAQSPLSLHAGERFQSSVLDESISVTRRGATSPSGHQDLSANHLPDSTLLPVPNSGSSGLVSSPPTTSSSAAARVPPSGQDPSPRPSGIHETASTQEPSTESWSSLVSKGRFQEVIAAAEVRGIDACVALCNARDLSALADAARYTAQGALAERALLGLRRRFGAGGSGSSSAFWLGRLYESRGQAEMANQWYHRCQTESPSGPFAADALAGRMRIAAGSQGKAAARRLALEYLRLYPHGVHASAARKLTTEP